MQKHRLYFFLLQFLYTSFFFMAVITSECIKSRDFSWTEEWAFLILYWKTMISYWKMTISYWKMTISLLKNDEFLCDFSAVGASDSGW